MNKSTESQQVSWWDVHEFVTPLLERVGSWPPAGTPAWCLLDDDEPAKWAALLDNAQHHALRVETSQQAECEASSAVSAAVDWAAFGRASRSYREFCAERPWLARRPS